MKKGKHIPLGYSMSTIWAFDDIENKHSLYRGKICMKKFSESLREHAKNVTEFEKKKNFVNEKRTKITSGYNKMLHLYNFTK